MNKQSSEVIKHLVQLSKEKNITRFSSFGISNAIITDLQNESYIVLHDDITGDISITNTAIKDFS